MQASVIIPSYNDARLLKCCLEYLNQQDFDEVFEVVVVDDGSSDNTQELLKDWESRPVITSSDLSERGDPELLAPNGLPRRYAPRDDSKLFSLKFITQKNKGRSIARNRGVEESSGDIILFLGANILPQKNWLKEHVNFHQKNSNEKTMAVGFMTWTKELAQDRFRKWLESSGIMFSFKGLKNRKKTDFWHFYTGNISIKKSLLCHFLFDETFKAYGWEDIMLGYEMIKNGGELYYLKNAKAQNCRGLEKKDLFPIRMKEIGKSAVLFQRKYPEVQVLPKGFKLLVFIILSQDFVIKILSCIKKEWGWYAESKRWFLEGVENN